MERFNNKYRIPSARLQNWNYGWNASYFITICTKNRICYFGKIIDGEMLLNDLGYKASEFWSEISQHFPDAVLDEFVVMPNHIHGIITIDKSDDGRYPDEMHNDRNIGGFVDFRRDAINRVSTELQINIEIGSDNPKGGITGKNNPMFYKNISRIIRWYKGRTSFEIHKTLAAFNWQPRFHDHIIRDEVSYQKIREYIQNNPINWKDNDFYNSL